MGKYKVNAPVGGYYTSLDAINKQNRRCTVKAGEYFIFRKANGAINVTTKEGIPGSWIDPTENENKSTKNNTNVTIQGKVEPSNTGTTSGYFSPSSKENMNGKYSPPNKDAVTCYIINLLTGSKIEFGLPEDLSDSFSANFEDATIRGRSTPLRGYDSSGPRQISFSLHLHDDYCKEGLATTVNKIKALTYPTYTGVVNAPVCLMKIGKAVSTQCTINSVGVNYQKPYRNGMYVQAEVSIDATETIDEPMSATDIESGGGT